MKKYHNVALIILVTISLISITITALTATYTLSEKNFSKEYNPDSGPDTTFPASRTSDYKLEPNVTEWYYTEHSTFVVETNSEGWRDREYSKEPEKDKLRIAAVGDSVTFGRRVNNSQNWPSIAENLLEDSDEQDIEVINFGSVGEDAQDKAETIDNWVLEYEPDMILLQLSQHDEQNLTRINELEEEYSENNSLDSGEIHTKAVRKEDEERKAASANETMLTITNALKDIESLTSSKEVPVIVLSYEMREGQNQILSNYTEEMYWEFHSLKNIDTEYRIPSEGYLKPSGHEKIAKDIVENLSSKILDYDSNSSESE